MSRRRWIPLVALGGGFLLLAWFSRTAPGVGLDDAAAAALRGDDGLLRGPTWWRELVRDLTAFGGLGVVGVAALGVALWQAAAGRRAAALRVLVAVAGAQATVSLLKLLFARPRPTGGVPGQVVHTFSFPSGHATLSSLAFLGLAAALARGQKAPRLRASAWALGGAAVAAVGFSRVGLGVHRPGEVLAGWCVGAAWLVLMLPVSPADPRPGPRRSFTR